MKKKFTEEPLGDFTQDSSLLSSAKVEGIASIITTLGYSLSTLATILALEEAEEAIQLESRNVKIKANNLNKCIHYYNISTIAEIPLNENSIVIKKYIQQ